MTFATVEQIETGWRQLTEPEKARANVLLRRASAVIRTEAPHADQLDPEILTLVTCAIVQRVLTAPTTDLEGASQYSETTGPYSESVTFSNPVGNFWLTKQERKWLKIGAQAFTIDTAPDPNNYPIHD